MRDAGFQVTAPQTTRLLQAAVRERGVALLEPRRESHHQPLNAEIRAVADDGLRVRPRPGDLPISDELIGVYCDGQIVIDDTPYVFEAYVVAIETEGGRPIIVLSAPDALTVLDRRVRPRVRLARSADVHVRWGGSIEPQSAVARLLNLSAQGLACQLDAASAAAILIGDAAEIAVPLGDEDEWLQLPATVRNKTDGSSPHAVLIGMEFNQQEMPAALIERLRRHVNAQSGARTS